MRRRKRQKGIPGIVKTVPLSIALAALTTTGMAFAADTDYDHVQVDLGGGNVYEFDLGKLSESETYANRVKQDLSTAFLSSQSILVQVGQNEWVEFGEKASSVLTLDEIKNATGNDYKKDRNTNAQMILPTTPYI
jgi:hypothetical protein